jgi:hypothetical protein
MTAPRSRRIFPPSTMEDTVLCTRQQVRRTRRGPLTRILAQRRCPDEAPSWGNGRDGGMRGNEDHNQLKTRSLESALQLSIPCGVGHASEIQLVANQYVSEYRVGLLRPISRSLLLAPHGPAALCWCMTRRGSCGWKPFSVLTCRPRRHKSWDGSSCGRLFGVGAASSLVCPVFGELCSRGRGRAISA